MTKPYDDRAYHSDAKREAAFNRKPSDPSTLPQNQPSPNLFTSAFFPAMLNPKSLRFDRNGDLLITITVPATHSEEAWSLRHASLPLAFLVRNAERGDFSFDPVRSSDNPPSSSNPGGNEAPDPAGDGL